MSPRPEPCDHGDDFDQLLDQALSNYAPPAPRPGLEQRVLASLANPPGARIPSMAWVWMIAAAAVLVLVTLVALNTRPPVPYAASSGNSSRRVEEPPQQAPPGSRPPADHLALVRPRHQAAVIEAVVHPSRPAPVTQFGRPRATSQELLISRIAQEHPELLQKLAATEPFTNAAVTISPLQSTRLSTAPVALTPITQDPVQITALP